MISKWYKVIAIVVVILLLGAAAIVVKLQWDVTQKQKLLEQNMVEMKHLQDEIVRSSSKYVDKEELDKFAQDQNINLKVISEDLAKLQAQIQGINVILATTPGYHGSNLPSTNTTPKPKDPGTTVPNPTCDNGVCNFDPFGYHVNAQHLQLWEPFSSQLKIPFGEAIFKAWLEKPWELQVFPRNYKVTTVLGQNVEGKHYTYNQFSVETQGKTYQIPIAKAEFVEQYPEPAFHINPRIHLTVGGGAIVNPLPAPEFTPSLQVFTFSYGRTKKIEDTQWSLLGVGLGFETQQVLPALIVSPAKYNLGYVIPYVDNLHIGPSVAVDLKGQFSVMAELSVGL